MKIARTHVDGAELVRHVFDASDKDMDNFPFALKAAVGQHHNRTTSRAAVALPYFLPHDQVHDAGFVFQRDERDSLRGAGPLP